MNTYSNHASKPNLVYFQVAVHLEPCSPGTDENTFFQHRSLTRRRPFFVLLSFGFRRSPCFVRVFFIFVDFRIMSLFFPPKPG